LRLIFGFTADRLKGAGAEKNALAPLYVTTSGLRFVGQGFGAIRRLVKKKNHKIKNGEKNEGLLMCWGESK
jgi:hypothetical protein